jgi:hypothetical protein
MLIAGMGEISNCLSPMSFIMCNDELIFWVSSLFPYIAVGSSLFDSYTILLKQ